MILNKLAASLSPIVNGMLVLLAFVQQQQLILALLAGLTMPFFASMKSDERQKAPLWKKLIIAFSMLCFLSGTLAPIVIGSFQWLYNIRLTSDNSALAWSVRIAFTVTGIIFHIMLRRVFTPELDKIKKRLVKKTTLERELRTDVRTVKSLLPETLHYDPLHYIDLSKGLFIGMDRENEPMYLPLKDWQKQHADIIGTTGAGKGVATGILLYQSILAGEGVFVMDPKDDEWAPHLYRKACEDAGKPFALIDLRKTQYQLNLIEEITADELEELFVAGFSLAEKGQESDFYRIDDRKAARMAAQLQQSVMFITVTTFRASPKKSKPFSVRLRNWPYSMPLIHRRVFHSKKYLMKVAAVMLSGPCETAKLLPPSACCWFAFTSWQKGAIE